MKIAYIVLIRKPEGWEFVDLNSFDPEQGQWMAFVVTIKNLWAK